MIFKNRKYDNLNVRTREVKRERTIMEIGKLSLHTTKSVQNKQNIKNTNTNKFSTNPFGVSFKGNVIQADVFESSNKATNLISQKSKMFASAVVSGINNFNEAFKSRINAIISFGKKVTSDVMDKMEKLGNTEITIDMEGIKNRLFPDRQYSVKQLSNKSVDELRGMWEDLTPEQAAE